SQKYLSTILPFADSHSNPVDDEGSRVPNEERLVINPYTKLFINLEGCVNTLRGECYQFLDTHGRDGRNDTARSVYPCYYKTIPPEERIGWRKQKTVSSNETSTEESMTTISTVTTSATSHSKSTESTTPPEQLYAYARFDLAQTKKELVIAAAVPSVLFLISAAALLACTRSVKVGDDAKMRCTLCGNGSASPEHEADEDEGGRAVANRRQQ
ncbi:hypothetical protein J437_LFUL003678, partial [Ladona fulva]